MDVTYVTIATRPHPQLNVLQQQYSEQGLTLLILGMGDENLTPKGRNYGVKIKAIHDFVSHSARAADELVLFTDAYDVLLNGPLDDMLQKYKALHCDILFGAEVNCHPFPHITGIYPTPTNVATTMYRYLNSGMFLGRIDAMRKIFAKFSYDLRTDDQGFWTRVFLSQYVEDSSFVPGNRVISLDYQSTIFQNMHLAAEHITLQSDGTYKNKIYGTRPNYLHFPGTKGLLSVCANKQPISTWASVSNNLHSDAGVLCRYYGVPSLLLLLVLGGVILLLLLRKA